ncbi:MAG TPA: UDP-N-acetylmuramyl-tripeptide synthetase [Patescibacteria group bacterium]|nr:UDP-N-acetylmuramyl-tripeptide synthetase [Patescibacteria group bacterium]
MDKLLAKIKRLIPTKIFRYLQPAYHFFLSWLAALVSGRPSEKLIVIGVTGTTGKTSSVYLIAKTLEEAGFKVGYTSTTLFGNGEKEWLNDKKMTMVGRFFTQKILKDMVNNGCQYAIVESTSEGMRQFRHRFINYDILVFTGLYPEHIESHGGFENYKRAKGELFRHLKRGKTKYVDEDRKLRKTSSEIKKIDLNRVKKTIIVNGDDEHSDYFSEFWAEEKLTYQYDKGGAEEPSPHVRIIDYKKIRYQDRGYNFLVEGQEVRLPILGEFNVQNAMNAVCVCLSQGIEIEAIKKGLRKIKGIAGRLEKIEQGQDFGIIVDYAFEPHAMEKLYSTLDLIPHERIVHVLGSAGGGRDVSRRPQLGRIAGEKADVVIVTNEDPYDEDPKLIIDQVATGAENAGKHKEHDLFKIMDRREAIRKALQLAEKDDIIIITGKGSEQSICTAKGGKVPWDDRQVVKEELQQIDH